MKQRYITTGIILGLLAMLASGAHAAYREEVLSPQALERERAARSSHHTPAYMCKNTATRCSHIRSKTASTKLRARMHDRNTVQEEDPIAALVRKHEVSRSARRKAASPGASIKPSAVARTEIHNRHCRCVNYGRQHPDPVCPGSACSSSRRSSSGLTV